MPLLLLCILALATGSVGAAELPTLPRVGVDMPGLMRGLLLKLAPVLGTVVGGYFALWMLRRSLRHTEYYFLLESESERKARARVAKDWERADKEDRRREARQARRMERDWTRALREDERRARRG